MNKKLLISFLSLPLIVSACGGGGTSSVISSSGEPQGSSSGEPQGSSSSPAQSSESQQGSSEVSSEPKQKGHTEEEVQDYMNNLKATSLANHVYYHYYRYLQDYNEWDVWAWPYQPKAGEGYRFDWVGRNSAADRSSATGDATIDDFGYATVDIDLTQTYNGGWNNTQKTIGGVETNFYADEQKTRFDEEIGLQIVKSETRFEGGGFWVNDGSNLYVVLENYSLDNDKGGKSYHIFVTQDKVQEPAAIPPIDNVDPFEGDDGSNVTYGDPKYKNVDFTKSAAKQKTSKLFLQGDSKVNYLKNGAGVGYQIMVNSFADSDGDGFGDIYGITKKIGYLKDLGVNVLWLTPIQMSDSYHGYDISDYTQVDPKFGSKVSPNVGENGKVTSATAMEDYKDLLDEAHKNGMAVVMDLVLNHTSTTNKWFIKSAQLNENYRGYYQWGNHNKKDAKNPYGQSDKINQEKYWYPYGDHAYSYYAKFGSSMPELNYAYVSTRAAVATMAKQWCEIGVDGFRMDAVKHIFLDEEVDRSSGDTIIEDVSVNYAGYTLDYSSNLTKNLHFWRQLAFDVKKDYPNCFFVGENFDGHAYNVAPYYEGFDSLFDFYTYFNLTTLAAKSWGQHSDSISGGPTSAHGFLGGPNSDPGADKQGNKWDLWHVLDKYDYYRSDKAIMGSFTSNHDIARTINRVAGYGAQGSEGLASQGNVDTGNFNTLDKLATLVQITELMLPGCTWIYYGDEIGMTGNFPDTTYDVLMKDGSIKTRQYDKDAPYADLWYRQPMKWTADGKVGDGSYTTGYEVTGSNMTVGWDNINKTATMKSVADQLKNNASHLSAIKAFANKKSTIPALIRGSMEDKGWGQMNYMFNMWRTLGNETYAFVANYATSGNPVSMDYGGKDGWSTVASFNGATGTNMPAMSAILLKK